MPSPAVLRARAILEAVSRSIAKHPELQCRRVRCGVCKAFKRRGRGRSTADPLAVARFVGRRRRFGRHELPAD